jgi:dTDP-4-amino-4,6-dideoxygalactose transaminase
MFINEASKLGITTRETYLPLHLHPLFRKENKISLPNCEKMGKLGVDIPSSIKLSENDFDYIAKNLKIIAKKLLN